MVKVIKAFFSISSNSFLLLKRTEPLILCSSTAFFATFSLSPILILLVNIFGIYFKGDSINNQVFEKIGATIGYEAALDIQNIVTNFMDYETTWWITIAGLIFFVFVATTLLSVVKLNIQKLWMIRKSSLLIRHKIGERLKLFVIILITGVLFLVAIILDSSLAISLDYLQSVIPQVGIFIILLLNRIFSLIIVTIWFTLIFKYLPEANVDWDVAFNGAFLTAILYSAGQFVLAKVLVHAQIASIFGASASFALVLLFIFYCSFILYYGAAFTHEYAEHVEKHIGAGKHGLEYEEKVLESLSDTESLEA